MEKQTILKITFNDDMRRVALKADDFESLEQQVSELFSLSKSEFTIKYKDDEGDEVSLYTTEELEEALRCAENNILRLSVHSKNSGKPRRHHHHHKARAGRGHRCGRWKNRWNNREEKQEEQPNSAASSNSASASSNAPNCPMFQQQIPFLQNVLQNVGGLLQGGNFENILENVLNSDLIRVEQNYICDGCDTNISGTRFHCQQCKDFDFCETCFGSKLEGHFKGHSFEKISALSALKEAISRGDMQVQAELVPGTSKEAVEASKRPHNAICDRCDQPIVGTRWKCFECQDFDFCNNCYLVSQEQKQDIGEHSSDHSFGKIEIPCRRGNWRFYKQRSQFFKQKKLEQVSLKKKQEQEKLQKLEQQKRALEQKLEEEKKRRLEKEKQLEQERLSLLAQEQELLKKLNEQPKEEPKEKEDSEEWVVLDSLAPMRNEEEQPKQEQPKIVYPFEQKLASLDSMGFSDRQRNIKLLIKHRGELLPVIQDLLN